MAERKKQRCSTCLGTGSVKRNSDIDEPFNLKCPSCSGTGIVSILLAEPCPECGGSKIVNNQPCKNCLGLGRLVP